jgi:lysophospholipid acyltransferase (LPLAT)-like uncharacterized protein
MVGASVIATLGATWRAHVIDRHYEAEARGRSPQLVYAFWHGRLLPLTYWYRNRSARILASQHADGELLGRTLGHLGFVYVGGSSTRGGSRAILELVDALHAGHDVGIAVDGPRGPRHVVKAGVTEVAKLSRAVIVPITTASRRHKTFSSWDRFELPHPFARVVLRYGPPVTVPADATREVLEACRLEVERVLKQITAEADHDAGA